MSCFSETTGQVILKERPYSLSPVNPHVFDSSLKLEQVVEGLKAPTTMAFLGPDDFLVLEKNNGTVVRVLNGKILKTVPRHMFSYTLPKLKEMMAMIDKESNQSETGFTDMNLWMTSL